MRLIRTLTVCALVATLALLSLHGVTGQDTKPKEPKTKGQLPQGWSKLGLTEDQKEQVYKLNAEHKEAVDKLKEEIAKLDAQLVKKRLAVLNDEQRKKLREMVGGEPDPKDKK
jgi:hypothetical protein